MSEPDQRPGDQPRGRSPSDCPPSPSSPSRGEPYPAPNQTDPTFHPQQATGAPACPGPGMVPPGYVAPRTPGTGTVPWLLGLLVFAVVPIVSSVIASVAMIIAGLASRKTPGLGRYNGAKAADWGLTYLLATVLLCGGHIVLLYVFAREEPVSDFFPLGIPITAWVLISVFHVGYCIYAGVRAGQGHRVGFSGIPVYSRGLSADF